METTLTKSLQKGSEYNQFDLDGDGTVTDEEIKRSQDMMELELREEKSEAQKKMAWIDLKMIRDKIKKLGKPHKLEKYLTKEEIKKLQ